MSLSRVSGLPHNRLVAWLQHPRASINAFTLLSAIGIVLALALLLIPPLPWNIRLPCYLLVLIWTILRPRVALYLMALAVPWGSLDFLNLGPLRLNSADILVIFLAVGWLMSWSLPAFMGGGRDRSENPVPAYLFLAILAFIGVMLLSTTVAVSKADSVKELAKWLEFIVLVMLGAQYLRTRRQIWTLVLFIVVAAISQACFGYFQAIFTLGPVSFVRGATLRVYGTFGQPNPYAGYLNMSLVITLALTLLGRGWLTRAIAAVATCLLGGAFLLTQSRGGEIAFLAALVFIILLGLPALRVWMRVALISLLALIEGLIAGWIPLYLFQQVAHFLGLSGISLTDPSNQDYSTAERLAHWIAGLRMYLAHPILGVGIGNYPDLYSRYYVTIFVNSLGQAHNYYINIAAETGTLGLVIYLSFITALLVASGSAVRQVCLAYWQADQALPAIRESRQNPVGRRERLNLVLHPDLLLRAYRHREQVSRFANDRALSIGLMAALITVCVHNLVDDLYDHSMTNLLALLLIALIRLAQIISRPTPNV